MGIRVRAVRSIMAEGLNSPATTICPRLETPKFRSSATICTLHVLKRFVRTRLTVWGDLFDALGVPLARPDQGLRCDLY